MVVCVGVSPCMRVYVYSFVCLFITSADNSRHDQPCVVMLDVGEVAPLPLVIWTPALGGAADARGLGARLASQSTHLYGPPGRCMVEVRQLAYHTGASTNT